MSLSTAVTRRTSRTMRAGVLAGIAATAVLALTGCIKVDANVAIASDATASGTFGFELQKEAASFLEINDLESFKSQIDEGALTEGDELDSFQECVSSESDTGYVYTCTFANTPFTATDGLWTITKEGSTIVFRMVSEGGGEDAADAGALLGDAGLGSIDVAVEFPGPITSVEGDLVEQTSETTAKISGSMMDTINVTIRSEEGSSGPNVAAILVVAIAAGVAVLLVVAVILLVMRRRAGTHEPATADTEADTAGVTAADTATGDASTTPDASATDAAVTPETPATPEDDTPQPGSGS